MPAEAGGGGPVRMRLRTKLAAALLALTFLGVFAMSALEVVHAVRLLFMGERTTGTVRQCVSHGKSERRCRISVSGTHGWVWLKSGSFFSRLEEGERVDMWFLPPDAESARLTRFPLDDGLVLAVLTGLAGLFGLFVISPRARRRTPAAASR